jgi:hypothetical protein
MVDPYQTIWLVLDMKTTVEIPDDLYSRARERAREEGRTLRSLIVDGLRLALELGSLEVREPFRLQDRSVGSAEDPDPLAELSWAELRDEIYGGR